VGQGGGSGGEGTNHTGTWKRTSYHSGGEIKCGGKAFDEAGNLKKPRNTRGGGGRFFGMKVEALGALPTRKKNRIMKQGKLKNTRKVSLLVLSGKKEPQVEKRRRMGEQSGGEGAFEVES